MTGAGRPPVWLQALLRLFLSRSEQERAFADLEAAGQRVAEVRGERAARRACVREAVGIVAWSVADRARRALERGVGRRYEPPGGSGRFKRRASVFGGILQDVRFAVRSLGRRPGFTALSVSVLALGIGANVSIFTLVDALFLAPPPLVRDPGRLVRVFRQSGTGYSSSLGFADYRDYRSGARSLEELAAHSGGLAAATRLRDGPSQLRVTLVSDNWFELLGVEPSAGRFFRPEENRTPDTHPVAVLSWGFWRDRLGGDPSVVGRDLLLNGRPFTVIGVAPRGLRGLLPGEVPADAWIPLMMRQAVAPSADAAWRERMPNSAENWLTVIGRLRPGETVARAQAELSAVTARIYPPDPERPPRGVYVTHRYRWHPATYDSLADLARLMVAAVSVLLAVAAANVAILLLARASARGREIGIRTALGAGRWRVVRQFLVESVLLGLAGGVAGLGLSMVVARVAGALLPVHIDALAPDARAAAFAFVISAAAAIVAGTLPALRGSRAVQPGTVHGRALESGGGRLRDALVVAQIALSLLLVTGAALFARSLAAARSTDIGFDPRNVLLVQVDLRTRGYDAKRGNVFVREVIDRVAALPGVDAATTTGTVPFEDEWSTSLDAWPGATFASGATTIDLGLNVVSPGYFDAMRIPILQGRAIETGDVAGSTPVIVINEALAREVAGGGDLLGRTIPVRGPEAPPFLVVGIARDANYFRFAEEPRPMVYGSLAQIFREDVTFIVKTARDPEQLVAPVERAIHEIDPDLPLSSSRSLESIYADQLASYRTSANIVGLAGLIALVLASAGLYGVMAYRVTERTREIGVRMALGATKERVARGILTHGLRLTLIGLAAGAAASIAFARSVQGLLYGVPARDPLSLALAPLVLLAVAIIALLVPARRAMAVDPMQAMRAD